MVRMRSRVQSPDWAPRLMTPLSALSRKAIMRRPCLTGPSARKTSSQAVHVDGARLAAHHFAKVAVAGSNPVIHSEDQAPVAEWQTHPVQDRTLVRA